METTVGNGEMFPIVGKLCSVEEISELAAKLRSLPEDMCKKVCPDVVKRIRGTEFINVVVDLYNKNEDLQFRRDATFLLRRVSYYGQSREALEELVDHGITKLILNECVESTDADLIANVVTVLRDVSWIDNFALLRKLVIYDLYSKIIDLLGTWKNDDNIVERLLSTVIKICFHEMAPDKDTDFQDLCDGLIDVVKTNSQLFKDLLIPERNCEVIGKLSVILRKYLGSIGDTELFELLIPPQDEIFSKEGISKLAGNLEGIPCFEKEVEKQVIGQLVSADFIGKFTAAYDSHSDEEYHKNLTYVMRRLSALNDKDQINSLVKSGVVKHLIKACEDCANSEVICNIFGIIKSIALDDQFNPSQLVEMGILSKISELLQKWCEDESVMVCLLRALYFVTNRDLKDIEESLTNTSAHGNIPNVLQEVLETNTSDSVIEETVDVIRNLVSDTDVLHTEFIKPEFFSNAFRQLKSGTLRSEAKHDLLYGVILTLANKNSDTVKNLLSPHTQSLKELGDSGDDELKLNVVAAILLYKYLDSKDDTENFEIFVAEQDKMFTDEGISKLAECIKAIPYGEEEFEKQVISKIVATGFIGKFSEAYDSHSEKEYRKNLLYVTDRVAYRGDNDAKSSLVKSGVVKHIIKACEHCTDSEFICCIFDIIKSIALDSQFNHSKLVELGILSEISRLLQKWCKDESVMMSLLRALYFMTCEVEEVEESLANTSVYGNIANVLQEVLETNTSDNVIEETVDVIKNLLRDTNVLQAEFLKPSFFSSAFNHLKSATRDSSFKRTVLRGIILGLADKNPGTVKGLLSPHIQSLKEISESGDDNELNVVAVILLYKYLGRIGDTERFELLVPPQNDMFTKEGISRLAGNIEAIPYSELEFEKQLLSQLVSAGCIGKFSDAYDSHAEEEYRRKLTYVLKEISTFGGEDAVSSLVNSGVSKHLIKSCRDCTDREVMYNISYTLQFLTYENANVTSLAEQGVLESIPKLLKRWKEEQEGERVVDNLISMLTKMTAIVGVKEQIASLINIGFNIPEVLADTFETSSDVDVLKSTIDCIKNMLTETMALHEHFSTQRFIDTCISRIRSDVLSTEYKVKLLWSIVTRLSYNNPSKLAELLAPHTLL